MKFRNTEDSKEFYELYDSIYNKKKEEFNKQHAKIITDSLDKETKDYYEAFNYMHHRMFREIAYEEAIELYNARNRNFFKE